MKTAEDSTTFKIYNDKDYQDVVKGGDKLIKKRLPICFSMYIHGEKNSTIVSPHIALMSLIDTPKPSIN